ncbi:MAG: sensor histidine kinase [Candidatus Hodarchaeota archaeon]
MESPGISEKVFCLFDVPRELDYFLNSALAKINIKRYLIFFSHSEFSSTVSRLSQSNEFKVMNIKVPRKATTKWKQIYYDKFVSAFFSSLPETNEPHNIYLDFTNLKVSKKFVEFIESSFEDKFTELNVGYSIFSLFFENKISQTLINQLIPRYQYVCLRASQIYPNFFYDAGTKLPTNLRDIYQPIEILFEELERNTLEYERINKELFMVKTENSVLESSIASILAIEKGEIKKKGAPADLVSVLDYYDLKKRYNQKSQMLSTITHDLKSPLAAIQGFAELLRDGLVGPVTSEMQTHLKVIISNTKRLGRMVESILEFEKYDQSEYITQRKTFDIIELIQDAKMSVLPQMIQKAQEVQIFAPDSLDMVGNRELLFRVLQNILDNAVKYSPQEKGKIELFAEEQNIKGKKIVKITVKDNGFGFTKANLKRVFDPFTRFEPGSTSTGLGLSISKKIVEIHKGTIEVTSPGRNKGTSVVIKLPKT